MRYKKIISPVFLAVAIALVAASAAVAAERLSDYLNPSFGDAVEITLPTATNDEKLAQSPIEEMYSKRAGQELKLFGYSAFNYAQAGEVLSSGSVRDDYILGIGDELSIITRGQINANTTYKIGADGKVAIDNLRPLPAAGLTITQFRETLQTETVSSLPASQVFVSLAKVRRIGVYILGEVGKPGYTEMSATNSVMDALINVGGVKSGGSLRRISIIRKNEMVPIDLYEALLGQKWKGEQQIMDGDRIAVPPIGPTFAVSGEVKRPAVFELDGRSNVTVAEALAMAGGALQPSTLRVTRLRFSTNGEEKAEEIRNVNSASVLDGDVILVHPIKTVRSGVVSLEGHVNHPGARVLAKAASVRMLLRKDDLLPDPYLAFGVVQRTDAESARRKFLPIDLQSILNGHSDFKLTADDTVIVLSAQDIAFLSSSSVVNALVGRGDSQEGECTGVAILRQAVSADSEGVRSRTPLVEAARKLQPVEMRCPPIFKEYPELLVFAVDNSIFMSNGTRRPGIYPFAPNASIESSESAGQSSSLAEQLSKYLPRMNSSISALDVGGEAVPNVILAGAVKNPGLKRLSGNGTLRKLITSQNVSPDTYPLLGLIERFDSASLTRSTIAFVPKYVLGGSVDKLLQNGDYVRLFSTSEIKTLLSSDESDDEELKQLLEEELLPEVDEKRAPDSLSLKKFVQEHAVQVNGAVRRQGLYPVADLVKLPDMIEAAGGFMTMADTGRIEVTTNRFSEKSEKGDLAVDRRFISLAQNLDKEINLGPGDAVQIPVMFSDKEEQTVTIAGEVKHPGIYNIKRGEKLSSLLARSGGLTEQAFPPAAVFTRESARIQEIAGYERAAQELDRNLAAAILRRERAPSIDQISLARQLVSDLRSTKAIGRITVEAEPAALKTSPELDILLEPQDRIYIPKRPLTVTVAGEVLSPASLQFRPEKTVEDYLREAGDLTSMADDDRIFVMFPDGSSRPVDNSMWRFTESVKVVPGCTIIVPRDPRPYDFLDIAQSVSGILGQLALTAASVAIISEAVD